MLRYDSQTKPGLVALYDIWPGKGAGPFLQPRTPHGVGRSRAAIFSLQLQHTEAQTHGWIAEICKSWMTNVNTSRT